MFSWFVSFPVQLWTVGNYHWYLKQSLHFESDKPVSVLWDPEHAYKLHIVSSAGKYLQYTWYWATKCSHGKTVNDQALVAVIDGGKMFYLILCILKIIPNIHLTYREIN